jgi:hypothetical protein
VRTSRDRLVTGRRQAVLRQRWTLCCLACVGSLALAAPALAQRMPDPAPAPPPQPKPESRTPTPPPAPAPTAPQPQSPPVRSAPVQPAASPPAPSPPQSPPSYQVSPPPAYQSPVAPAPPPAPSTARRGRGRTLPPASSQLRKQAPQPKNKANRRVTSVSSAVAESSSPDTTLLIGGLALVLLVLGNTVFLTLTTRVVRVS